MDVSDQMLLGDGRGQPLRLRTLILLRWMATFGQLGAITVADMYFHIEMPLGWCYVAVGVSISTNLVAEVVYPANTRLTERAAFLTLLFDVLQLAVLLSLTGGLTNPFALLLIAPATISASALNLRTTVALGATTIALVTLIAFFNLPMRLPDGTAFTVPVLFVFGFWLSLVIGVIFLGLYSRRVATEISSMSNALLATQMALSREQKLTDLGGVVAAAAHELGTPLATIKLVSTELIDELDDQPELKEDALLIRQQADRCRDILQSMGRAGKDDLHLRQTPISALLREAAEPHLDRGKEVVFTLNARSEGPAAQPSVSRRPEIIHGLRNLIQNAVDFAHATVWVDAEWDAATITVRIIDDGDGYPPNLIGRLGDPLVRRRRARPESDTRAGYEGMGLGLFIAKTLLERSGAEVNFANGADPFLQTSERPDRSGAIAEVVWPRNRIEASRNGPLGHNLPFEA